MRILLNMTTTAVFNLYYVLMNIDIVCTLVLCKFNHILLPYTTRLIHIAQAAFIFLFLNYLLVNFFI